MNGINKNPINANSALNGVNENKSDIQRMPSYNNALAEDTVEISSKKKTEPVKKGFLKIFQTHHKVEPPVSEKDIAEARAAFKEYQYNSDKYNKFLRKGIDFAKTANKMKNNPEIAESFLQAKMFCEKGFDIISEELPENTAVYRLVFRNGDYPADWKVGDVITEKGFTSTSSDADNFFNRILLSAHKNETPVKLKILLPKGTKVVTGDESMSEVLIKNGSSFKVVEKDPETDTYTWELTESGSSDKKAFSQKLKNFFN